MKRNELEVGQEYVVLAPSQRAKVDGRYAPNVKRVRVLDTEPVWVERSSSWRRDDRPQVRIEGFDGKRVTARDATRHIPEPDDRASDYYTKEARKVVKVLVGYEHRWGTETTDYTVEVKPASMVAMPWAEYAERRAAADERRKAENAARASAEEAAHVRHVDAVKRRDKLNELLASTNLVAKLASGEVVIAGPPQDLLDIAELAANA